MSLSTQPATWGRPARSLAFLLAILLGTVSCQEDAETASEPIKAEADVPAMEAGAVIAEAADRVETPDQPEPLAAASPGKPSTAPAAPARVPDPAREPETERPAPPEVIPTGDGTYELGEIRIDARTREVRIPGTLNLEEGLLEYAIVHENGKIHESLLRTTVRPFDLQIALLLLKYKAYHGDLFANFQREGNEADESPTPESKDTAEPPPEADQYQLQILVEWKDEEGAEHFAPLADWLYDEDRRKTMDPLSIWQFVGLVSIPGNPYKPEHETGIAAVYLDGYSPFNYAGEESRDDETWIPRPKLLPPLGTPVTIVFRPLSAAQ